MALVGISGPRSVNTMGGLGGEEEKKWPDSGEDFACFFIMFLRWILPFVIVVVVVFVNFFWSFQWSLV